MDRKSKTRGRENREQLGGELVQWSRGGVVVAAVGGAENLVTGWATNQSGWGRRKHWG